MEENLMKSCESTVSVEIGGVNEDNNQVNSSKRRKVLYSELQSEYSDGVSPAMSGTYGDDDDDDDELNGVVKKSLKSSDLEKFESQFYGFEAESPTYNEYFREMTPTREYVEDSELGLMITPKKKSQPSITRRKISPNKLPSMTEFDEFFAEIEKSEAKRFAEKYNFDIVKDVPLEGKYQWVRLHHH